MLIRALCLCRDVEFGEFVEWTVGVEYGYFYEVVGVDGGGARGVFGGC
jgi:hypothetical protein